MKYNPALDGIRAIAVIMVMCFHAMTPSTSGGYLGVDVFFVLSGFLITSLLLTEFDRTHTINIKKFYKRRLIRLTPPLILMLTTFLLVARFAWPKMSLQTDIGESLVALFYLSDYASAFWGFPPHLRHTWSLAVEEHFYLIWPVVILLLHRLASRRHQITALCVMYVLFTAWRIAWDLQGAHSYDMTYYRFDTRLSGLTVGSLLAFVLQKRIEMATPGNIDPLALVALFILAICTWRFTAESKVAMTVGMICVEFASLLLIYVSVRGQRGWVFRTLSWQPMAFIGRMSYGLYLWHYPIFYYMWERFDWYVTLLLGGAISLLMAFVSFYTVERVARLKLGKQGPIMAAGG